MLLRDAQSYSLFYWLLFNVSGSATIKHFHFPFTFTTPATQLNVLASFLKKRILLRLVCNNP